MFLSFLQCRRESECVNCGVAHLNSNNGGLPNQQSYDLIDQSFRPGRY